MVNVTQYLRPNGRKRPMIVDRPFEIEDLASSIIYAGYTFEAEVLTTGEVSLTISNGEEDVAIEITKNGPEVLVAFDTLVTNFTNKLKEKKHV